MIRIGYNGSEYERPELKWTQSSFIQPQMMAEDRYFYDPVAGKYTVDRYLDDLEKRYGGIDSVLIWHDLSQHRHRQSQSVRSAARHAGRGRGRAADDQRLSPPRGARALPHHAVGPRARTTRGSDWEATAKLMAEIGADGINGDTLRRHPARLPHRLGPDGPPAGARTGGRLLPTRPGQWNNMTWGYWKYPFVPMISRYKWLEPRHMVNVCDRWDRDKTDDLQYAFFNGVGYESWENIWGIWNQITPRDAEALRRMAKIERAFAALPDQPRMGAAHPHPSLRHVCQQIPRPGRDPVDHREPQRIRRGGPPDYGSVREAGCVIYDVWHGEELKPEVSGSTATLSFEMEAHGFGAMLATDGAPAHERHG